MRIRRKCGQMHTMVFNLMYQGMLEYVTTRELPADSSDKKSQI